MNTQPPMVTLTIDGRAVSVPKGTTVYHAARAAGIEIPIFCYHDRMPPLGACRMCLVQVEKTPKLQTSCTLEAGEGMVVRTATPEVHAGQEAILEYLLINHPLDCPICDKGGECPLQDQTYRWGPGRSRYTETKRDFAKPVALGPVLVLDRERCILCWRCVRFGEIIAGDDALKGFARGFESNINTPFTLPVDSKFIGNTISICPVGALTSRSYRFIARPWDNRTAPSVCTLCGVGCAVWLDARGESLTRVRPREEREINDVWLCDLGYFGHHYVNHEDRLRQPLVRRDGRLQPATWEAALDLVASRLRAAGPRVGVLAGPRMTTEEAYVAARFFRTVVGTAHLDHRADTRPGGLSLDLAWGMRAPIAAIERADLILLVGCDVTEEYPVLWLRMKQAADRGAKIVAVTPKALEVDRHLAHHLVHRYGEGAGVMQGLLAAMGGPAAGVGAATEGGAGEAGISGTDITGSGAGAGVGSPVPHAGREGDQGGVAHGRLTLAARALAAAQRPMVLVGALALDAPDASAMWEAIAALCARWGVEPSVMRGRGNAFGAALAGLLPGRAPGGRALDEAAADLEAVWGAPVARGPGLTSPEMLEAASRGDLDLLYIVGADPATDVPDARQWDAARGGVSFVVVHEAFLTRTAASADVVLPALVLPEKDGTVSNIEGRVQSIHRIVAGPGEARGDAVIFAALAGRLGWTIAHSGWQETFDEMRALIPHLAEGELLPPAGPSRVRSGATAPAGASGPAVAGAHSNAGQGADAGTTAREAAPAPLAPPSPAASGGGSAPGDPGGVDDLVLIPGAVLFDQGSMSAHTQAITHLAGTPWALLHPQDARRRGVADGDAVVLTGPHGAVALRAVVRPWILPGQVYVPRGFDAAPLNMLVDASRPVTTVRAAALAAVAGSAGPAAGQEPSA